ncbi:unnamed protein product [Brassica oleracea]|uniref:(rape) hypothetical protein n=1 Tax=Brassica napus TaxID=3708 RepID=A0A816K4Z3_BRANA|nr:unnamed protein product [Brassica napus]
MSYVWMRGCLHQECQGRRRVLRAYEVLCSCYTFLKTRLWNLLHLEVMLSTMVLRQCTEKVIRDLIGRFGICYSNRDNTSSF